MKKVLIVGYFGYGNLGDEETLSVLTTELDKFCIPYHILGCGKPTAPTRRFLEFRHRLRESSAVLFGGGNLLQNESSSLSLIYYLSLIRLAKASGIPIFFAGGGIGELRGGGARKLVGDSLRGVDFFGARTLFDFYSIKDFEIEKKTYMPDVCFTLPTQKKKKRDIFAYIPRSENPSVEEKIRHIYANTPYAPIIIPMHKKSDYKLCYGISKRLCAPLCCFDTGETLMAELSACRFCVCERLHGAIFSLLSHTPAFLLGEREKCRALIDDLRALSAYLGIDSPLIPADELCIEKIKELGAFRSEFDVILNSLYSASSAGISRLMRYLYAGIAL